MNPTCCCTAGFRLLFPPFFWSFLSRCWLVLSRSVRFSACRVCVRPAWIYHQFGPIAPLLLSRPIGGCFFLFFFLGGRTVVWCLPQCALFLFSGVRLPFRLPFCSVRGLLFFSPAKFTVLLSDVYRGIASGAYVMKLLLYVLVLSGFGCA